MNEESSTGEDVSEPADLVDYSELSDEEDGYVEEYDILSAPNDWNVLTIVNYMESGAIKIPPFQRNYVWDLKKASRLVESLLLGLPVPQIFLYEESRNSFLVIDGQQRLLTIFFYLKGRFPRPGVRGSLREMLRSGEMDTSALSDDLYFQDFKLKLPSPSNAPPNRFHGLKYVQLGEYRAALDLRTLRNVVVKQVSPSGAGAIYEIFNRLNSGGVNLSPQEIRASLYHSRLMTGIMELNEAPEWRRLIGKENPDSRMKDAEILLRAIALAIAATSYKSPMVAFVNEFCIEAQSWADSKSSLVIDRLKELIIICQGVGPEAFRRGTKFSPLLFEAVICALWDHPELWSDLSSAKVRDLGADTVFVDSMQEGSTKPLNVQKRLEAASRILHGPQ